VPYQPELIQESRIAAGIKSGRRVGVDAAERGVPDLAERITQYAAVSTAALEAGKHVWSEKPITVDRESAQSLVDLARQHGLLLGVAPDTLLGRGWQTGMRAIVPALLERDPHRSPAREVRASH
jgi:hypothetical protein